MTGSTAEGLARPNGTGSESDYAAIPDDVKSFLRTRSLYSGSPRDIAQMELIAQRHGQIPEIANHLVRSPRCPAESIVGLLENRVEDLNFVWYTMVKHSHQLEDETVGWAYDNHGADNWKFAASLASYYQLADELRERAYDDHGQRLVFAWILASTQSDLSPELVARAAKDHGQHPDFATSLARRQTEMTEDVIRLLHQKNGHYDSFLNALAHHQPNFPEDLIRQSLDNYGLGGDARAIGWPGRNDLRLSDPPPLVKEPMTNIFIPQYDPDKDVSKFPPDLCSQFFEEDDSLNHFIHGLLENQPNLNHELLAELWNHPAVSQPHARHYIAARKAIMPQEIVDRVYQQSRGSESALTDLFDNQPNQPAERLRETYNQHKEWPLDERRFLKVLYNQANLPEDIRQEIRAKLKIRSDLGQAALEAASR